MTALITEYSLALNTERARVGRGAAVVQKAYDALKLAPVIGGRDDEQVRAAMVACLDWLNEVARGAK